VANPSATVASSDRSAAIDRLRRILELEQRRGCDDKAVIGGVQRFLTNWVANWLGEDRGWAEQVSASLGSYASVSQPMRKRLIDVTLSRLVDGPGAGPGHSPPVTSGYSPAIASPSSLVTMVPGSVGPEPKPVTVTPPLARPDPSRPKSSVILDQSRPPATDARVDSALDEPIDRVKGVGAANSDRFAKLGVATVRDLLYLFPRRHLDYRSARLIRDLTFEGFETILASVWRVKVDQKPGGLLVIRVILADESGTAETVWIRRKDYVSKDLPIGKLVVMSGECRLVGGRPVFKDPDWEAYVGEDTIHTARLVPVYPLVEGLNGRYVRRITKQAVDQYAGLVLDPLPAQVRSRQSLLDLPSAIAQAHFPDTDELKDAARRRLAFDELLVIQIGLQTRRRARVLGDPSPVLAEGDETVQAFLNSLPFQLTGDQARALNDVRQRLASPIPMSLLLQGDVGSGKTVVAAAAAIQVAANGYQTAIMAPTEILAEQHLTTFQQLLSGLGEGTPRVALLTGSVKGAERRQVYADLRDGKVAIVAGTQALLQEGLEFARLGLVVIDEQHRFGVSQRGVLRQKGYNPHVLVMTATPIPRTLALTLHGDLDLVSIHELPPGRQMIKTRHLQPTERVKAYEFVRREVKSGHQAFVICPLVEETGNNEAKAATVEYERLKAEVFPNLRLGLLHGRMKPTDKDSVMRQFKRGDYDILVATSVVEVGIDVPNATVMLIEGANRFGLAQLHQFRGRVGRGKDQSYCLLISDTPGGAGDFRLTALEESNDGFRLAEVDLEQRGPGEFFGTRQSGLPDLKMATFADTRLLERARDAAIEMVDGDPRLNAPEHRLLRQMVEKFWQGQVDLN
jgi:ATP-dependent DNA helicase RecG